MNIEEKKRKGRKRKKQEKEKRRKKICLLACFSKINKLKNSIII